MKTYLGPQQDSRGCFDPHTRLSTDPGLRLHINAVLRMGLEANVEPEVATTDVGGPELGESENPWT